MTVFGKLRKIHERSRMQILDRIFARKRQDKVTIRALYDHVLAGALDPVLYESGAADDTFDGRFEQVALHGALVLRALRKAGRQNQAKALVDVLFSGFDHAYRETGVGDSSISRKVRKLGERFYGLARGLNEALEEENQQALVGFLARNSLADQAQERLANYLSNADKALRENQDVFHAKWPVF